MYSIIIERSKDQMQVVAIFTKEIFDKEEMVWDYANKLYEKKNVKDYDVLFFEWLWKLNEFLLDNIKI